MLEMRNKKRKRLKTGGKKKNLGLSTA